MTKAECIMWEGYTTPKGYGRRTVKGRPVLAHRHAWFLANGPIPDGLCVLHRCDNPGCINVDHLFLGTNQDNVDDKMSKGRHRSPTGSEVYNAKLTEDHVHWMRMAAGMGRTGASIARQLGVSRATACRAINGTRWCHV